jgi:hypothetical protein
MFHMLTSVNQTIANNSLLINKDKSSSKCQPQKKSVIAFFGPDLEMNALI